MLGVVRCHEGHSKEASLTDSPGREGGQGRRLKPTHCPPGDAWGRCPRGDAAYLGTPGDAAHLGSWPRNAGSGVTAGQGFVNRLTLPWSGLMRITLRGLREVGIFLCPGQTALGTPGSSWGDSPIAGRTLTQQNSGSGDQQGRKTEDGVRKEIQKQHRV